MDKHPVIGIDLGTTNTCIAGIKNDKVEVINNNDGKRITPSVVLFTETGMVTGDAALDLAHMYPKACIQEFKRIMGRKFFDEQVSSYNKIWPTEVFNDHGQPKFRVETKADGVQEYLPEQISAFVLCHMKKNAEEYLGYSVTQAVITVPAYFNDAQRQATKDAGTIAGLKVIRVLNEPTAAAIAYCWENESDVPRNILIYDFGGGTFDVTILKVDGTNYDVLATDGDSYLGGSDIDMNMVNYLKEEYKRKHNKDIGSDRVALRRLKAKCEHAKKKLSNLVDVIIELDSMDGVDVHIKLTRARFEDINGEIFARTIEIVEKTLKASKLSKENIDDVVVIGGSSRIPRIQELVKEFFDDKKLRKSVNPDEAVAIGAAIQGIVLRGEKTETFQEIKIHDVTSLALGTSTQGDLMSIVIEQNTKIPAEGTKTYYTVRDKQTVMDFPIYQGNRPNCHDNFELGEFAISGLTSAPPGQVKVVATFKIDANGILSVSATESTGKSRGIDIDIRKSGLSDEMITLKIEEAKKFMEKDKELKKILDAKNELESYCIRQKSIVINVKKDLPGEKKKLVKDLCDDTIRWLDELSPGELNEIEEKLKKVKSVCDPILQ